MRDGHFGYLWAAYRMGVFGFAQGLTQEEFSLIVLKTISDVLHGGGDAFVVSAKRPDGKDAVMAAVTMMPFQGQFWPHVYWFPWATPRNRIECALRFLIEMKKKANLVLITTTKTDVDFYMHLCRYGVVRRIGEGRGWLGDSDIVLFETVRR